MKKKILIVEDDCDLANLFKLVLEISGYEPSMVHNGCCAMDILQGETMPDAVLLDMHLPGISGEKIYDTLARLGHAHRVLVCSADVQLIEKYRSMGAHAITKPALMQELQKAIQEILENLPDVPAVDA